MSELIVVGFNNPEEADRVLLRLSKLRKEYLIDIEDAVVVVRDEAGKAHLKQSINTVAAGTTSGFLSGGLWGTFVGLVFLNPLAGFVLGSTIGAGTGALTGSLIDYGINDDFIKSLAINRGRVRLRLPELPEAFSPALARERYEGPSL